MRRAGLLAAALVALTVGASAAGATSTVPRDYYLALGDSMAYGFQPTKAARGLPPSAFDTGYVDVFATRLRALAPGVRVVNYGCPGESTVTFTKGGCPWLAEGKRLHDVFRGSQLDAALAFLRAHPGEVSPITVTLGATTSSRWLMHARATLPVSRNGPGRSPPVSARSSRGSGRLLRHPRSS